MDNNDNIKNIIDSLNNLSEIFFDENSISTKRENKGNNLTTIPDSYIVIDIETTGLDPYFDEIIEIGALKIENNHIVDSFNSLIKLPYNGKLSPFIEKLTGISNEMLKDAPKIKEVLPKFLKYIGNSILIGHNVNFDINFLYDKINDKLKKTLSNNFVDLMRLSRKLFPELPNHKLITIAQYFNVSTKNHHRALEDCEITFQCLKHVSKYVHDNNLDLIKLFKPIRYNYNSKNLTPETTEFDETHMFYKKHCVFTGTLQKMKRMDAIQKIVNLGGYCEDKITKKTNYLILGCLDYSNTIESKKSSKLIKAENLILNGQDLTIISENVFYDILYN